MIRTIEQQDIEPLVELWLDSTIAAHPFIPKDYWYANLDVMRDIFSGCYLESVTYVYELNGEIKGLLGLMNEYIGGIFVSQKAQSTGVGRELLNFAKSKNSTLTLNVYKKNVRAINFYLREGFSVVKEQIDEKTGELELFMKWN